MMNEFCLRWKKYAPHLTHLFVFVAEMLFLKPKIRIGYVLKSADVGTLFSSRYSENSSHAHTHRHPHTFTHTCAHTCAHLCTPAYTHIHAHTGSSSSRWVWTDQSYVIRLNIKKAEEEERKKDRRKKEGTRVRWKHQRTKNVWLQLEKLYLIFVNINVF